MNAMPLVALFAAVTSVAAVFWAFRQHARAVRAEARLQSVEGQADLVRREVTQSATAVAAELLKANDEAVKAREEQAQALIAAQLKPVTDKLQEFQKQVADAEKARSEDAGSVKTQINHMMLAAQATREETQKLTNALKRGAGIQGRWGEQMLRNVLELAGLRPGIDFEEQVHKADEDGAARPDVVVRLPSSSYFVIDSKVSLTDYETFLSTSDELARGVALKAHCESMRRHVVQLSSKTYWARFDKPPVSRSPDIVVMFVPLESAFACAVEQNPSLVAEAWEKKVAIVTPAAMFPLLRAVAYGWRAEDQAANAREIAAAGRELHKRVSLIAKYAVNLGGALKDAMSSYNEFAASLERNVLTQAKRFEALSVQSERPIAELPHLDIEQREFTKLTEAKGDELVALTGEDA